jgi:16S rRNA (guanine(966)-N(2))-methyltransferase RsmD
MSGRVIAGSAKGLRLKLVPGDSTRPIMDKVKEALFNILGDSVQGAAFLDLFAGTGAVGIEALSRNADYALFTEIDRLALKTIHENLETTRLADRAEVRMIDAFSLLKRTPPREFDFIYVAPPQYKNIWRKILDALEANPAWLSPQTVVIVQIDPREQAEVLYHHLRAYDERRYGKTLLWFFEAVVEDE